MVKRRDKGQGGLTKRADGRWQGSYHDAQGRTRYVYAAKKREAQEKLTARINEVLQGTSLEPGRVTVASFMERWLRDVKAHDGSERSSVQANTEHAKHIVRELGRTLLRSLTAPQVQEFYSTLLADGYSPTTVRHIHTTLSAMLRQALDWNIVARNVAKATRPPKRAPSPAVALSGAEVRQLLTGAAAHRMYPAVALAVTTGMRLGELRGLVWGQVALDRAELSVTQSLDDIPGGGWALKVPKSLRGRRTIALGATAVAALERQREHQRIEREAAGPRWEEHGLVFTSTVGTPLNEDRVLIHLNAMQRQAGVRRTRFHDLRHTHTTALLLAGVPVHVVAARLGDDPVTILRTYAHLLPTTQREAADRFEAILADSVSDSVSAITTGDETTDETAEDER